MRVMHWKQTLAIVLATGALTCAAPRVQADDLSVSGGYRNRQGSVGFHLNSPMDYHHMGHAYTGADYAANPGAYYRYGAANYGYGGYNYAQGTSAYPSYYGYGTSGYGNGYGYGGYGYGGYGYGGYNGRPQPEIRPTWYSGVTVRYPDSGATSTFMPGGYTPGMYPPGAAVGDGCNDQAYVVRNPTLQWRTASSTMADYDGQTPQAPCEPLPPRCEAPQQMTPPAQEREAQPYREDDRDERERPQPRRQRARERELDRKHDRADREDRGRDERPERRPERRPPPAAQPAPGSESSRNLGNPGLNEWWEPQPQNVPPDAADNSRVDSPRRTDSNPVQRNEGEGWRLLRQGKLDEARVWFSDRVMDEGNDANLKIGYAISSAATGKLATGVWAMRRALRLDGSALNDVRVDRHLAEVLRDVNNRYSYAPNELISDNDSAFMAASLHYLLGEFDPAAKAVQKALTHGDDSKSTIQLKALIDTATENQRR